MPFSSNSSAATTFSRSNPRNGGSVPKGEGSVSRTNGSEIEAAKAKSSKSSNYKIRKLIPMDVLFFLAKKSLVCMIVMHPFCNRKIWVQFSYRAPTYLVQPYKTPHQQPSESTSGNIVTSSKLNSTGGEI